jgi:hypothetical protein
MTGEKSFSGRYGRLRPGHEPRGEDSSQIAVLGFWMQLVVMRWSGKRIEPSRWFCQAQAVVSREVGIFLEPRIGQAGKHLPVGIHVDVFSFGML